ncbi:DUF1045 domain-containing protein [Zavarzinia compransoris]|uniref:Phosphonate metabolism protein n=1 Tax=Zavarzinia compransoris TaxID=1264899 RepID=A0A317E861_9PROT|nr:DUF1045 domain-containing protein [Zavarzinia compransoris]PWR23328.1 hypothetical protein DKG75_01800 [Zavarzinia compransoris]TDP46100.1 uncharacterized protein DUF1045 [Zavarzinia compransoris]
MASRYAVYWAPPAAGALHRLGAHWLGRDPATGATPAQPLLSPITPARFADLTADARRYGFHATLKPPIRLVDGAGRDDLLAAVARAAAGFPAFEAPGLKVGRVGGFLALVPEGDMAPWRRLSDHFVRDLDPLRAAAGAAELEKRRAAGLTPAQDANLTAWGYPYLFDEWRFHMTLTCRLTSPERERVEVGALGHFAGVPGKPVAVTEVAVFEQADDGPFQIISRHALNG